MMHCNLVAVAAAAVDLKAGYLTKTHKSISITE
jgi:hypothetical protein